jgi:VanZ family protein
MYCMLAFLSYRAIVAAAPWRTFALIAILISAFGALDEWHQQFIPGRSMEFNDWIADTSGGVTGVSLAMFARAMSARGARRAAA